MTAKIIDGVKMAEQVRAEVRAEVGEMRERGITPGLAAILVGENPASAIYIRNKSRACQEVGIFSETFKLSEDTREGELLTLIDSLNKDPRFHGILLQLPLPGQINESRVINTIDPRKDIDGLHPINMGRLFLGEPVYTPCTPAGVQQMLLRSGYSPEGRHVVVCGRSVIVGKPMAAILMQKKPGANATVTICHTGTKDLPAITRQAEILIAAMGSPRCISADMVKEGVVVIDVGINRVSDPSTKTGYRLVGDVDFDAVKERAEAISPVPGGVGPMTIAMLLVNTTKAARLASNA